MIMIWKPIWMTSSLPFIGPPEQQNILEEFHINIEQNLYFLPSISSIISKRFDHTTSIRESSDHHLRCCMIKARARTFPMIPNCLIVNSTSAIIVDANCSTLQILQAVHDWSPSCQSNC